MDPEVGDWFDIQSQGGAVRAQNEAKRLEERMEFWHENNKFKTGKTDVSRLIAGVHDYVPMSPANMIKGHTALMIWTYAVDSLARQGLIDPMLPTTETGGSADEKKNEKMASDREKYRLAVARQFCRMTVVSAGGFVKAGHILEVKAGPREEGWVEKEGDFYTIDRRPGDMFLVAASDKYGAYGIPLERAKVNPESEFKEGVDVLYELTVPNRTMLDPIRAELDDVYLWRYNPVATPEGLYMLLDQSISLKKWCVVECGVPRTVLVRIGDAYGKTRPRQNISAGTFAKSLFSFTIEEMRIIDELYVGNQSVMAMTTQQIYFSVHPKRWGSNMSGLMSRGYARWASVWTPASAQKSQRRQKR